MYIHRSDILYILSGLRNPTGELVSDAPGETVITSGLAAADSDIGLAFCGVDHSFFDFLFFLFFFFFFFF